MLSDELYNLKAFFKENSKVALGFTGGVNSTYLLYVGKKCGANIRAYYVKTAFQPWYELDNAIQLTNRFDVELKILEYDIFQNQSIINNNIDRCYLCKKKILSLIKKQAIKDGFTTLIEGSDASDKMEGCSKFISNLKISLNSPLKELGITKTKVRMLSKKADCLAWDKPAYSCLVAQIPVGTPITKEILQRIEHAERELLIIGFTDFQIEIMGNSVKLKVPCSQMEVAVEKRRRILECLKPDFDTVLLDLKGPY